MKKKLIWLIIGFIAIIVIAYSLFYSSPIFVQTAKASKNTIYEYIDQRAETTLPEVFKITMPFDGRIKPITYPAGSPVLKDEVIAGIVTDELETKLRIAIAAKEEIEGMIKMNEYNAIWNTADKESIDWISGMKKIVDIAVKRLSVSKNITEYAIKYRDAQILSGLAVSELQKAQAEMDAAVKILETENAALALNATEILLGIFELAPTYIREIIEIKTLEKAVLESRLKQAEEEVNYFNLKLNLSTIKSPINGIVLERYIENERFLNAGSELLDIGNLDELNITADVLTTDISKIKIGDVVNTSLEYFGENTFPGKVSLIEPQAFTKVSSLGVEEQRVKVKINIDKSTWDQLKANNKSIGYKYRVFARIITDSKSDALTISRTALTKNESGFWEVFKIVNGKAYLQKVKTGLMNDETAEILGGLNLGDEIVIAPPEILQNGSRVKF